MLGFIYLVGVIFTVYVTVVSLIGMYKFVWEKKWRNFLDSFSTIIILVLIALSWIGFAVIACVFLIQPDFRFIAKFWINPMNLRKDKNSI